MCLPATLAAKNEGKWAKKSSGGVWKPYMRANELPPSLSRSFTQHLAV